MECDAARAVLGDGGTRLAPRHGALDHRSPGGDEHRRRENADERCQSCCGVHHIGCG